MRNRSEVNAGFDWPVDRRRARTEQFPSFAKVMREKPGTPRDRVERGYWASSNRVGVSAVERDRLQLENADQFIAEMKARESARFLASLAERRSA